eukprot:s5316_g3.t1
MADLGTSEDYEEDVWEDDYFDEGALDEMEDLAELEEIEELEAKQVAWRQQMASAMESGDPVNGLPQGLRMRVGEPETPDEEALSPKTKLDPLPMAATRWEFWLLALVCLVSLCTTLHFTWNHLLSPATVADGQGGQGEAAAAASTCRQCKAEWWQDFWQWRFKELQGQPSDPPAGMQWEWGNSMKNTDWYQSSEEFVDELVRPYADPGLGPVLHLGCGDAPVPELLLRAGFAASTHIDVASQVIEVMRSRYPAKDWPGLDFQLRDFLKSGPPADARYCAVLDKAGIWDWLQEEAPQMLPHLLRLVRQALVPPPAESVYVIATKQTPAELAETLAIVHNREALDFHVEATRRLGNAGVAWGYVLSPL